MAEQEQIDFKVDTASLYREDAITDLKVASIRRMVPVTADRQDVGDASIDVLGETMGEEASSWSTSTSSSSPISSSRNNS